MGPIDTLQDDGVSDLYASGTSLWKIGDGTVSLNRDELQYNLAGFHCIAG